MWSTGKATLILLGFGLLGDGDGWIVRKFLWMAKFIKCMKLLAFFETISKKYGNAGFESIILNS